MKRHYFKLPKCRLAFTQRNDTKKALISVFKFKFCHSQVCSTKMGSFAEQQLIIEPIQLYVSLDSLLLKVVSFRCSIRLKSHLHWSHLGVNSNFPNYEQTQPYSMEAPLGGEPYNINTTLPYYLPSEKS